MAPRLVATVLLALSACAREVPPARLAPAGAAPAAAAAPRKPKGDPLAEDVASLSKDLAGYLQAQDEALWSQWTVGTAIDVEGLRARFPALFRAEAVLTVRQARQHSVGEPRALAHLEVAIAGLQIAVAAAPAETALANLEASLTFSTDDRDVPWRELSRLLANEPSALKRKSLWTSSHRAAERIAALIESRDNSVLRAHRAIGLEPDAFSEQRLELDLDSVAELAELVLARTEAQWHAVLERRAKEELGLPLERVTRGDLPRLLRPSAGVDAAFAKDGQAARATGTFIHLGLLPNDGVELALDEARVKGVLPLGLLVGPFSARLANRPRPGLRPQAALLNELGRLIALHAGSGQRFEYARLGAPLLADVAGALFESLLARPAWLSAQRLSPEVAAATARAYGDLQLFDARRSAAMVLASIAAHGLGPVEAREEWRKVSARALGLSIPPEEGPRWKLELEAGLAPAHALRVRALAAWLDVRLSEAHGAAWWQNPNAAATLRALWSSGTAVQVDERLATLPAAAEPWLAALAPAPVAPAPTDGGLWTPVPFPTPRALADGGMWTPVPWGKARALADGGT